MLNITKNRERFDFSQVEDEWRPKIPTFPASTDIFQDEPGDPGNGSKYAAKPEDVASRHRDESRKNPPHDQGDRKIPLYSRLSGSVDYSACSSHLTE
jgi:hypothetical protein